jgi:hypothetical protein
VHDVSEFSSDIQPAQISNTIFGLRVQKHNVAGGNFISIVNIVNICDTSPIGKSQRLFYIKDISITGPAGDFLPLWC